MNIRILVVIGLVAILLSGCSKSDFEICVKYYEDYAKRTSSNNWRVTADYLINQKCSAIPNQRELERLRRESKRTKSKAQRDRLNEGL